MKIFAIGDIVGPAGTDYIRANLWRIRRENNIDCVIANGENCAVGNGIDPKSANIIIESGVDIISTGNHVWHKHEIYDYLDSSRFILRPANYPVNAPGSGYSILEINNERILFVNLMGNIYMETSLDSPFDCANKIFIRERDNYDFAVVDIHAEATGEKLAIAKYLDGRYNCGLIFGTHTHVQTADEQILRRGSGYITDIGMTGSKDSILGVKSELIIRKYLTRLPVKFEPGESNIEIHGVIAEIVEGVCQNIVRVKF